MARKLTQLAQKTVSSAGTAEAITSSDIRTDSVIIQALNGNTNLVYVGDSNVDSTNGYELSARESITITPGMISGTNGEVVLSDIFIDVDTNGEGAKILYFEQK